MMKSWSGGGAVRAVLRAGGNGTVGGQGALVNQGTVRADVNATTLHVQTVGFVNQGTLEQTNGGTLVAPGFP